MDNQQVKSMYEGFLENLSRSRPHLNEHELFLVRLNVNSLFNQFKMVFRRELKEAGLSWDMSDVDLPDISNMFPKKESEVTHAA